MFHVQHLYGEVLLLPDFSGQIMSITKHIILNEENDMKQETYTIWDRGWNDFWDGKNQNDCPTYPEQEERDEWMLGWLAAQDASLYEDRKSYSEPCN